MDQCRSLLCLPRRYDSFLFALVCKEFNGAPLSVLSVLARMDLDPWDEAERLGAMQRASAKSALSSMLNRITDGSWSTHEVDGIAAQLVRLLTDGNVRNRRSVTAAPRAQPTRYWLILLTFALALSLLVPHGQAIAPADSISNSVQTSPNGDGVVSGVPAGSRPLAPENIRRP